MSQVIGLDIGVASVGWAVINEKRIVDLGVRCFDKAETSDKGEPLNLARRQARLLRRRLCRRAWRLTKLARLLKREGLIDRTGFFKTQPSFQNGVWNLRVEGLDRLLEPIEWARVIYHLCKHRGFHWMSKAEEAKADADDEGGRVKKGLQATQRLMREKGYRTAAEMVMKEFPDAQRNKNGQYDKALSRVLLDAELKALFETQRSYGNSYASIEFEAQIRGTTEKRGGLFWEQKPALSGVNLLKMLGYCTFEKSEYRAPKASFSAERHVWLTKLNNLRVIVDGQSRALSNDERSKILHLPYQKETVKYKTLKDVLVKEKIWDDDIRFGGLSYPSQAQIEHGQAKNPEEHTLVKLSAWHELKSAFKKAGQESIWQQLSHPALEGSSELLDEIAWILSVYKDEAEVLIHLKELSLPDPDQCIQVLEKISFEKFSNLSIKALKRILPLMEMGLRYDEAVAKIVEYGHHSHMKNRENDRKIYLPYFYEDARKFIGPTDKIGSMLLKQDENLPRNPVVLRALNQARKVLNALIKTYGSPTAVHIEMARDLSRPLDERRDIEKLQKEYRDKNLKAKADFEEEYGFKPRAQVFEKFMLYREQQGQCAYSQQPIDLERVLDDSNYVQIDHALPYSRSYDDSKNNKVLVLTKENQAKGNRTPYEYLTALDGGEEGARWRTFQGWVVANKSYRLAKRNRLLRKNFGLEESKGFVERNLNDTRYICRFFKNFVEANLHLMPSADGQANRRCVVVNGQLTAFLRARWGLVKVREESDRHHALDAAVVAACGHSMVKALADHSRRKELEFLKEGFPDPETGEVINPEAFDRGKQFFPEPWPHFRHELEARLWLDDVIALREHLSKLGTYSEEELSKTRSLFVSRAPQRRNVGAVHKDTIYAQSESSKREGKVIKKVALSALKLSDLDNLLDPHRNERLYQAIKERLEAFGGKAEKAFSPENPFFKPSRDGNSKGPRVNHVKVLTSMSGIPIRGGLAKNDSMLRVDVYSKAGKFYLIPIYVHHQVTGMPNLAIVAHKPESDWILIDDTYIFEFSLYSNDFVRIHLKNGVMEGYYSSCDRASGSVNLWVHDRAKSVGKDGLQRGIGVKTARKIEKFSVDVLGRVFPLKTEEKRGLA